MALRLSVRIGLIIVAVAAGGAVLPSGAVGGPPTTGAVAGHYTQAGQPVGQGSVTLMNLDYGFAGEAALGVDGGFEITDVAPGQYYLSFLDFAENRTQFYHSTAELLDSDPLTVAAGVTTVVDEEMLPTGTLRGRLTHADGTAASGVPVTVDAVSGGGQAVGVTGAAGDWELHPFAGRDYRVSFTVFDGESGGAAQQYVPQAISQSGALPFAAARDRVTTADDRLLPAGAVSGKFSGDGGLPVAGGSVNLYGLDGTYITSRQTDENGGYLIRPALAGQYQMRFADPSGSRTQWAHDKLDQSLADPITVTGTATTVVDERLLALGAVDVFARDLASGGRIIEFCTYSATSEVLCSNGTGHILVTDLPPGPHFVTVFTQDKRYLESGVTVTVQSGGVVDAEVRLQRGGTISTSLRDRLTGAPVADVCVSLVPTGDPNGLGTAQVFCGIGGGGLIMRPVRPGSYRMFADARNGVHGDQWVTNGGGVGRMDQAVIVTVAAGQTLSRPPIPMDRAGKITGVITDAATGAPLPDAVTAYTAYARGFGGAPGAAVDINGRYTYDDLGPYKWVLYYGEPDHASQFTGGVGNRTSSPGVQVLVGQVTTADVALTTGSAITGAVIGPPGVAVNAIVTAYNAVTGDVMEDAVLVEGEYTLRILGPQTVKLHYQASAGGVEYTGWFQNATTMQQAWTIAVQRGVSLTVPIFLQ